MKNVMIATEIERALLFVAYHNRLEDTKELVLKSITLHVVDETIGKSTVVTRVPIKARELRLVPFARQVHISKGTAPNGSLELRKMDNTILYMRPELKLNKADTTSGTSKSKADQDEFIVPFWLVRPTADKEKANLVLETFHDLEHDVCTIEFINPGPLKAGHELFFYKPSGDTKYPHPVNDIPSGAKGSARKKQRVA